MSADATLDAVSEARSLLRAMSDLDFCDTWTRLEIAARSAAGLEFIERFRRLSPYKPRLNGSGREGYIPADVDDEAPELWPQPLDLRALAERDPVPPRFVVAGLMPCGYATLLAGHGGVGKSAIALHLAVCIALGLPFFGVELQRRRVLYLSCEDRQSTLHWRLARICAHLRINLAELHDWLEIVDLVGKATVLWARDPRTGYTHTPAFGALADRVKRHATQVLVADGISDTFGGNENNRAEVKAFVNALLGLVPAGEGALLLVGHVNRQTASGTLTTEGYSGSTGWHNAVRSRLYLYPELRQGDDGERSERTGDLLLEMQKSNAGPGEQSMRFNWSEEGHLFVGREIVGRTAADRADRHRRERDAILAALADCAAEGIVVPAAMQGPRTALHVLQRRSGFPESLSGAAGRRRFWAHIEALRHIRAIEERGYRRSNRQMGAQLALVS